MTQLVDYVQVARDVEKFYLSGLTTSTIPVTFNSPINQNVPFKIIRKQSYQETLNYILSNIKLYISTVRRIVMSYDNNTITTVGIGAAHTKLVIDAERDRSFRNYILKNEYLGNHINNY